MQTLITQQTLKDRFLAVRYRTETICKSLERDDYSVQPEVSVSPPKWHLGHTTWFFEQFVLSQFKPGYKNFHKDFSYCFNSYYNNVGSRILRVNRSNMTRPTVDEIYNYRSYVSSHLAEFLETEISEEIKGLVEMGLQHEEQHQELLVYDIKYIFGHQPLFPVLDTEIQLKSEEDDIEFISVKEGIYEIGHQCNETFCFDNELGVHKVYLNDYKIANRLVTNAEYIEFIEAGGYSNFNYWHADGWTHINENNITSPMYWHKQDGKWMYYTLKGLREIDANLPVNHVSFYEAWAYAEWKGLRLPTEFEWEIASSQLNYGQLWEWTNSAYLPYPKYAKADGAIGEYNGKFMVNTMVLRGSCLATAPNHSRPTYRNFFTPESQWQFSGIRLAK